MVGRQTLDLAIWVRILVPELTFPGRLIGRTTVSEAANLGSSPSLGTKSLSL